MKLLEAVEDSAVFLKAAQQERTPGLHLSDIIKRIMVERDPERFSDPLIAMRLEVGFIWEQIIERALRDRLPNLIRIGEIEEDGILMTPDALEADGNVLEEWKATTKTSSEKQTKDSFETDLWYWLMQVKAYARRMGVLRARIRVFYLNGDYGKGQYKDGKRPPLVPQVYRYELEFTQRELDENWRTILSYKKKFGLGATSTLEKENSTSWQETRNPRAKSSGQRASLSKKVLAFPATKKSSR